jgi:hypothetical protein
LLRYFSITQTKARRTLTEKLALDLLERDGIAVIWNIHLTAVEAYRDGHPRAAEILVEIGDAAERCLRLAMIVPRWRGIAPSP